MSGQSPQLGLTWVLVRTTSATAPRQSLCPLLFQILKRLYKALSLLKKEFELSKLQQRLGREVMGRGGEGMRPGSNSDLGFSVNRLTQNLHLHSPLVSAPVCWDVRHVLVCSLLGWAAAQ